MTSKILKVIFSLTIVATVLFFTGGNLFAVIQGYIQDDRSIFSIALDQVCIPMIHTPTDLQNKKIVILRLDDVQTYTWRDISIQMIRDAQKYNAPVVAGVIPKNLTEDHILMRFLKRENCNIEIAMHGWDHSGTGFAGSQKNYITEFGNISYSDARDRIDTAKQVLEPLRGRPITTFIPPFNITSAEAARAISDEGIPILSSIGTGVYDYHSDVSNVDTKRIMSISDIYKNCEDSFSKNEPCIVMMHPQDYANDENTIDNISYTRHYIGMLQYFLDMGVVFVTFDDLRKSGLYSP